MPTTHDTPEAALAAALDHSCVAHRFDSWEHWKQDHAVAILAAMQDWTLVNEERLATAMWDCGVRVDCGLTVTEAGHRVAQVGLARAILNVIR
jgi:hypothetical protein